MMCKLLAAFLLTLSSGALAATTPADPTEAALQRCLDAPTGMSTAGQTECESAAWHGYDRRMNTAYTALMRHLPAAAGTRLRAAQRAWLAFRTAEDAARMALYETREGTMYVPMQAADATQVVRDRALQLEGLLRVLTVEGP